LPPAIVQTPRWFEDPRFARYVELLEAKRQSQKAGQPACERDARARALFARTRRR